ncbi:MAG TPA: hypothetical protein EYH54_03350 [Nautiliaceae bacterium]|nr:hypothetical protein [Nautiliaceae bacterium]
MIIIIDLKIKKRKKGQANVIEYVLLLAISLLVIYEIYMITENLKKNLMDETYYKSAYLVTNYIITNYMEKELLKKSIKAKQIAYKYYLPENFFSSGFSIITRNVTINNTKKKYLVMYSYDLPKIFKMSYNIEKDFFAHPGINKEVIQ